MVTVVRAVAMFAGRLVRAAGAGAVLAGMLVGIPYGLVRFFGWPLPDHLPRSGTELGDWLQTPYSYWTFLTVVAIALWIAWARFAVAVAVELVATIIDVARFGRRPKLPRGVVQGTAAVLVGALIAVLCLDLLRGLTRPAPGAGGGVPVARTPAVATTTATAVPVLSYGGVPVPLAVHAPRSLARVGTTSTGVTAVAYAAPGRPATAAEPAWVGEARAQGQRVYQVCPGDTLWTIAETQLGDPWRWREIFTLNRGKPQPTGYSLTEPDEIDRTWYLVLPAAPHATAPSTGATGTGGGHDTSDTAAPSVPSDPPAGPAVGGPDNDGVTASDPTPTALGSAAPGPAATTAASGPNAATPAPSAATARPGSAGVDLPSGAWLSAGLVVVLAGFAAAVRLHRRRRARLRYPVVLLAPTAANLPTLPAALRTAAARTPAPPTDGAGLPVPLRPSIAATATGTEVSLLDLAGRGGALTGPGATAAARAVIAAALAASPLTYGEHRGAVIVAADLYADLTSHHPSAGLDRLRTAVDADAALTLLERELDTRRGDLARAGVDSPVALADHDACADPMWLTVLVVRAEPALLPRITALLAEAATVRLGVVLLGDAAGLPTLNVAADGTVTAATDKALSGGRLSTLAAADLTDLLAALAETQPTDPDDAEATNGTEPAGPSSTTPTAPQPAALPAALLARDPAAPVHLAVLGPTALTVAGRPVGGGRRTEAFAVAAYLAAHPDGATLDELAAVLLPDIDPEAAKERIRTGCKHLRAVCRNATGLTDDWFVRYTDGRYRLEPELIDVDLWRMQAAVHAAALADSDTAALAALSEAADCYHGEYAAGLPGDLDHWRDAYRRQAVDVLARIAELEEADHADAALRALEHAIDLDRYNESLYQRVMIIQGRCGRPDAVRRTFALLESRLYDIDTEASDDTHRLLARQLAPSGAHR